MQIDRSSIVRERGEIRRMRVRRVSWWQLLAAVIGRETWSALVACKASILAGPSLQKNLILRRSSLFCARTVLLPHSNIRGKPHQQQVREYLFFFLVIPPSRSIVLSSAGPIISVHPESTGSSQRRSKNCT